MDGELQPMKIMEKGIHADPLCSHSLNSENEASVLEECSEEDDSDDDYASIQRPAFFVDGEPNFDSGPPEDGWEYLRRVRWEADQIPRVKVAKVDRSKLNKDQSDYMPKIPDVAKCPEHLLPLKEWEDVFLAEFSALRGNLSRLEGLDATKSNNLQLVHQASSSLQMPPLLSAILEMDPVARASMLLKRISLVETANTISRNDCMWLFALCAAVDAPLDADTCAALRSLLRKCATIRAGKPELDDELIMLNILATIAGRYFGQSET